MALIAPALALLVGVSGSAADEHGRSEQAGAFGGPVRRPASSVYFASFEAAERRFYGSFGAKFAPAGRLDRPGFRLLASAGAKLGERVPATGRRESHLSEARLLAGHEWQANGLAVSAYAGLALAVNAPEAQRTSGQSHRLGPALLVDLWQSWPENAFRSGFTAAGFVADGAGRSLHLGLRHGFGLPALPFAFGPEASIGAGGRITHRGRVVQSAYRKARLGLHLSEIGLFGLKLAIAGGAEWRDEAGKPVKTGGYARLAGYVSY